MTELAGHGRLAPFLLPKPTNFLYFFQICNKQKKKKRKEKEKSRNHFTNLFLLLKKTR